MEEIRLWKIHSDGVAKPAAASVETIAETTTEQLLEDVLTQSPDVLMQNLRLIGRQTDTPGGPLDLLGIDEDGRLVVFELKRGNLTRDAVAQAIDYASYLADLEAAELNRHITDQSGKGGTEQVEDFGQWYQANFQRPLTEIGRPKVVLVGLGVDERAKRMVAFLAQCELDISLITFHGFKQGNEILLARQVEVQARSGPESVKSTKRDNEAKLTELLSQLGISSAYETLTSALKGGLGASAYQWPNPAGYSYYLPEVSASGGPTNRAYIALYAPAKHKGSVQIVLQARAIEAIGEPQVTAFAKDMGSKFVAKPSGWGEIWVDARKDAPSVTKGLTAIGEAIASGWKAKLEHQAKGNDEGIGT